MNLEAQYKENRAVCFDIAIRNVEMSKEKGKNRRKTARRTMKLANRIQEIQTQIDKFCTQNASNSTLNR